jgi:Flp pilus assembly protein TadD
MVLSLVLLSGVLGPVPVGAWSWDEDEIAAQDDLAVQLEGYHKRVESGISLQERIVLLDRLIKLYKIRGRDTRFLEDERAQVLADDQALQSVSAISREKSQALYQQGLEQARLGNYKQAQTAFLEAERLNSNDKIIAEMRQKVDAVATILPQAPTEPNSGDLVKRGVMQYLQNDPAKALNFLMYAQQKNPQDQDIPELVDMVKKSAPESMEILDTRLNLIDQKLQKALEKIYSGEYLVAAKECQEVLDLEPDNALALTRLGSVYYAMGQVKQARVYWQQAFALDPKNDVLKSFLQQSTTETDRAPAQALTYKVEKGDTLMIIAEKIYKNRSVWRKIYDANRAYMKNPYQLVVGQVLVLPPGVTQQLQR